MVRSARSPAGESPDLPELQGLARASRIRVWRQATHEARVEFVPWVVLFVAPLIVIFGGILTDAFLATGLPRLGFPMPLIRLVSVLVPAGILVVPTSIILHQRIRRRIWQLAPHLCDDCGYDLTANVSGACPECGRRVPAAQAEVIRKGRTSAGGAADDDRPKT